MGTTFVLDLDDLDRRLNGLLALKAEAELAACDWAGAAAHATTVLEGPSDPATRCGALRVLALLRARRGDPEAWPLLDEALALAGDARQRALVAIARAEVAWLDGCPQRAAGEAEHALPGTRAAGEAELAAELAGWAHRGAFPAIVAGDEPRNAYEAALALVDGDRRDELLRAFSELRALGAHGAARAVARRLERHGVRGLPRGPRCAARADVAGLTPREREVLELVSQGLRNGEISERLVVSRKTVDHHVSAILRKLDVPTRTAAAHWLRLAA